MYIILSLLCRPNKIHLKLNLLGTTNLNLCPSCSQLPSIVVGEHSGCSAPQEPHLRADTVWGTSERGAGHGRSFRNTVLGRDCSAGLGCPGDMEELHSGRRPGLPDSLWRHSRKLPPHLTRGSRTHSGFCINVSPFPPLYPPPTTTQTVWRLCPSAFQKLQMVLCMKTWVREDKREIKTKSQDASLAKDIKVFSLASSCPSFKWTDFFSPKNYLVKEGGRQIWHMTDMFSKKNKKNPKISKLAFNIPKSSKLYYQITKLPRLRKNLPSKWFFN